MDRIKIYGINIENISLNQALNMLKYQLGRPKLYTIATPNTEIVMEAKDNPQFQDLINSFDLVVADGIGLVYASRYRKMPLKERVTGYDLSLGLLQMASKEDIGFYFLGGQVGVVEEAKARVEKDYQGAKVVGHHHGYFNLDEEEAVIEDINKTGPDVIFVGLGSPKQEEFIQRNVKNIKKGIIIGNGGVLDILAGRAKRAPDLFIKLNLEWLYRLISDPSRIKRQLAIPKFILNIAKDKDSVTKGD